MSLADVSPHDLTRAIVRLIDYGWVEWDIGLSYLIWPEPGTEQIEKWLRWAEGKDLRRETEPPARKRCRRGHDLSVEGSPRHDSRGIRCRACDRKGYAKRMSARRD